VPQTTLVAPVPEAEPAGAALRTSHDVWARRGRSFDRRALRRVRRAIGARLPLPVEAREVHLVTLTSPATIAAVLPLRAT
jgi:hypothetical protein